MSSQTGLSSDCILPPLQQLHAYCINLDRRPDRWTQAQLEWARLGCRPENLHRIAAIDTDSYVGCARSHQLCIRTAQEQHLPYVFVIEDDVQFRDSAAAAYERLRHRVPKECGIFYGGVSYAENAEPEHPPGMRALGDCAGLFCAVYFAAAYEAVLAWQPSDGNIDRFLGRRQDISRIVTVPYLAGTSAGRSDLRKRETKDDLVIRKVEQQLLQANPAAKVERAFASDSRKPPSLRISRAAYLRGPLGLPAQSVFGVQTEAQSAESKQDNTQA